MDIAISEIIRHGMEAMSWASDKAAGMDGRAAFALGVATMFMLDRLLIKLTGIVKVAVIATVLAGVGGGGIMAVMDSLKEPQIGELPYIKTVERKH